MISFEQILRLRKEESNMKVLQMIFTEMNHHQLYNLCCGSTFIADKVWNF